MGVVMVDYNQVVQAERVPSNRVHPANQKAPNEAGDFVVYWMISSRRLHWNFGLQRAIEWANQLKKPLLIVEGLRTDYPWANDRHHAFILEGMKANAVQALTLGANYRAFVATGEDSGKGLLESLWPRACVLITDLYPCFFLPKMVKKVSERAPLKMETVDSNGLIPLAHSDRFYTTAHSFRRFAQKVLIPLLQQFPQSNPLENLENREKISLGETELRFPVERVEGLEALLNGLERLPIDHSVPRSPFRGGSIEASAQLRTFIETRLKQYDTHRNGVEQPGTTQLSPYLHYGHISAHEVVDSCLRTTSWSLEDLRPVAHGSRQGWWNLPPAYESFLDQIITWRELGYHFCFHRSEDYDKFESLPNWALKTLAEHAADPRPETYTLHQLECSLTEDPLWNAAQRELVETGLMHNYLRMLWGKKVLQWSPSPKEGLETLIHLNNKYALDGRDPNSYSGIFWVFGRFDRAWGPERPLFGKIRYMTSANTQKKMKLRKYLDKYSGRQVPKTT